MKTFYEFDLGHEVIRSISELGFETATPIQEQTIPIALEGRDVIGQAQTGTGKTAAFGLPIIEKSELETRAIQAIVLTPTRELAIQVAEELNKLGHHKGVRTVPIYGGQSIDRQIRALKNKPQLIVATPGRLMDHMRRKTIRFDDIKTVVLDEADEMLNMGFVEDIELILSKMPSERQTLLFSATMPNQIRILAEKFMSEPQLIQVKAKEMTVSNIEQQYIEVQEKKKFDVLCRLLDIQSPELAIVFGRTKKRVDELSEALIKRGYFAEGIHGDLTQIKRDQVIRKFKEKTIEIMVATDVAARGLDISGVTHVYNFDIPQDPESYVHRIGRTGRAGHTGLAITFVTPRELDHLKIIEKVTKTKITKKAIPTYQELLIGQRQATIDKLLQTVEEEDIKEYKVAAEQLLEDMDSVQLLSAALKLLTKEPDTTPVQLSAIEPLRAKKVKRRDNKRHHSGRGRDRMRRKKHNQSKGNR